MESLKGVDSIGGYSLVVMDDLREKYPHKFTESGAMDHQWFEKEIRPNNFVYVRHDKNSISFTIQDGPIKENGINGCQVDTMIQTSLIILKYLNQQKPCTENSLAITKLEECLYLLDARTKDRVSRGVEGTNND